MPYIKKSDRRKFEKILSEVSALFDHPTVGELNYLVTEIVLSTNPTSYTEYNALIGALECCKLELYRRAVAVYEDKKIDENGDVYGRKDV